MGAAAVTPAFRMFPLGMGCHEFLLYIHWTGARPSKQFAVLAFLDEEPDYKRV
jgi:hypothetical protein